MKSRLRCLAACALAACPLLVGMGPPASAQQAEPQPRRALSQLDTAAEDGSSRAQRPRGTTQRRTLDVEGQERTYRLYVPPRNQDSQPLPLVISLHGAGASGAIHQMLCRFDTLADEHQFLVAYPDGIANVWRFWDAPPRQERRTGAQRRPAVDDVAFMAKLIDSLVSEGMVEPRRVYVNGISNGAYMTHRLACDLGNRLAAVAAVAGTMPRIAAENQRPPRPIPCLYFHGTADKIVNTEGIDTFSRSRLSLSADDLVAWWARHNRCSQPPAVEDLPDVEDDGTRVRRHTYQPEKGGAPVVYYEIIDGGHTWPGGSTLQPRFLLGRTCRDINASQLMWEFFSQYELPDDDKAGER
jgi:polyhydroxybutyrate depolymerase